ncbi:MAG: PAS domain S-box protein [Syntrophobacteraceae bacterium]|jgi:PAS domain S-box-containing protein
MKKRYFRVLLIEDDEDDYMVLRDMLSEIGSTTFHLEWVKTYEAGVEGICRAEHDVYLLDYRLGAKDGVELLREVMARGCSMPIILLTGQGGYDVDIEAMEAGAADYLVKGQITAHLLERSIRYSVVQKHADLELIKYRDYLEQLVRERTRELEETNGKLQIEIDVRRKAEKASRQLAAIVESSDDSIISQTLAGIITSWNKAAEIIYGYTAAEAIGQPASLHIPPEHIQEVPDMLARMCRGERIVHHETTRRRKNGEDIKVSITISPIRDDSDSIIGASTIARDITERERVRKEREKLIMELREALAKVKTLKGLLPICAWCKKVRDDRGYWQQIEAYIRDHSEADFSHGICPTCAQKAREEFQG